AASSRVKKSSAGGGEGARREGWLDKDPRQRHGGMGIVAGEQQKPKAIAMTKAAGSSDQELELSSRQPMELN
ncbi:hypothetical protein LTR16_006807, partial [Cryomyces antarcticus]